MVNARSAGKTSLIGGISGLLDEGILVRINPSMNDGLKGGDLDTANSSFVAAGSGVTSSLGRGYLTWIQGTEEVAYALFLT